MPQLKPRASRSRPHDVDIATNSEDPGLQVLLTEVDRAFGFFNSLHFEDRLPRPIFAFFPQPPNGRRLGHYCPRRWNNGDHHDEIVFYADLCLKLGMDEILHTLLHEMCHLWQW